MEMKCGIQVRLIPEVFKVVDIDVCSWHRDCWWFHGYIFITSLIKLLTLNMYSFLMSINTSIKIKRFKNNWYRQICFIIFSILLCTSFRCTAHWLDNHVLYKVFSLIYPVPTRHHTIIDYIPYGILYIPMMLYHFWFKTTYMLLKLSHFSRTIILNPVKMWAIRKEKLSFWRENWNKIDGNC